MRHVDLRHGLRRGSAALAVVAAVGMVATPVLAASTVDQSYAASFTPDVVHDVNVLAQTFTPGLTGALTRVDLSVGRFDSPDRPRDNAGPLTVSIETTLAGKPTGIVLASTTLPLSTVPNDADVHPVVVTLPPSLSTAKTEYAIVLSAPLALPDTAWLWEQDDPGSYGPGAALQGDTNLGTWTIESGVDHTFTTYVDPSQCAPGSYSTTGYGVCTAAGAGHFVAGPASTTQSPCPLGTFQPNTGSAACIQAPVGSYVDTVGAVQPIACPNGGTTSGTGSTSVSDCISDTTPPVITPTVTGTLGRNGWYTSDVTLSWSVVEPETPGSLVTTGCENQAITTDQAATTYSCSASSTGGAAGRVTVTIKRDATPPSIVCSASPGVLWPPNNKLVPVTVTVTTGGATSFTLVSVSASSGVAGDMQGWATGTPDTTGLLRASRSGTGGARTYTLTYQAVDDAGNTAGCSTAVVVPHDMGAH